MAIKANVTSDNAASSILFSPDRPPLEEIPGKHILTMEQLFQAADLHGNGEINYLKYAGNVFQSYKHLPDRFQKKLDSNGDDTLNREEFSAAVELLEW